MENIKRLILANPIPSAIVLLAASIGLTEIPLEPVLQITLDAQSARYLTGIITQFLTGGLLVGLVRWLGLLRYTGFSLPGSWKSWLLTWPILVLTLVNGSDWVLGKYSLDWSQPVHIVLIALVYLSTGFIEEVLARGAVLALFIHQVGSTRKGILLSVLGSSLLFGLLHLTNLVFGRYSTLAALTQVCYALFFGVFFAASVLRSRSLWPAILTHAVFDLAANLSEVAVGSTGMRPFRELTGQEALITLAATLPLFLYGLFLLRKVRPGNLPAPAPLAEQARERKDVQWN